VIAFNKPLAVLVGAAVIGSAAYSGHVASQFRKVFLDFDAELPAATRLIVDTPFIVYLTAGAILGVLAGSAIWVTRSKVRAVLIAISAVVAVIGVWIGFAVSLMSPMAWVVHDLSEATPQMTGEQRNAADSR
jgi:type II secretory pathway component PulF